MELDIHYDRTSAGEFYSDWINYKVLTAFGEASALEALVYKNAQALSLKNDLAIQHLTNVQVSLYIVICSLSNRFV